MHPSPSSTQRPNLNPAIKFIQDKGLQDRTIGVFTKADGSPPDQLRSFITGEACAETYDEDDGSIRKASEIGAVPLTNGWITTMLRPLSSSREEVMYFTLHTLERVKKIENEEKLFFGDGREPILRDLYDRGLAGTNALATRLMEKYYEHVRTTWLTEYLHRLCKYELELHCQRALLGAVDNQRAYDTTQSCLTEEGTACFHTFIHLGVMAELGPKLTSILEKFVGGKKIEAVRLDDFLAAKAQELQSTIDAAVSSRLPDLFTTNISMKLRAPVQPFAPDQLMPIEADEEPTRWPCPPDSSPGYWQRPDGTFVRALFGTDFTLESRTGAGSDEDGAPSAYDYDIRVPQEVGAPVTVSADHEWHMKVLQERPVQLSHFSEYCEAVRSRVRSLCEEAAVKISSATRKIIDDFVAPSSPFLRYTPYTDGSHIGLSWSNSELAQDNRPGDPRPHGSRVSPGGHKPFVDMIKTAIIRYLPTPSQLKSAVEGLRLSDFGEDKAIVAQRQNLTEAIDRIETAMKQLIEVVDVDPSNSLAPVVANIKGGYGLLDSRPEPSSSLGDTEEVRPQGPSPFSSPSASREPAGISEHE